MTENRWYDERFIKCKNCKQELIVYPLLGKKFFRCKYCGNKIRNKEYHNFSKKYKKLEELNEKNNKNISIIDN